MMKKEKKLKKFKDAFLKPIILESLDTLEQVVSTRKPGEKTIYYSGNFQEDVLNNFSQKQSKKIFKQMQHYQSMNDLTFVQKKVKVVDNFDNVEIDENKEPRYYYDYTVIKGA